MFTKKSVSRIFSVLLVFTFLLTGALPAQAELLAIPLNSSGNFVWAKSMGGTTFNGGEDIAIDSLGNVYTTGSFSLTADFDPGVDTYNLTSAGEDDIFVSKLDSGGNFLWAKRIGGTDYDYGYDITLDSLDNVYVTGTFRKIVDFNPGSGTFLLGHEDSFSDIFVLKLDKYGIFVWAMQMEGAFGGGLWDEGYSIAVDQQFNVYTAGSFTFSDILQDVLVTKLNSSGIILWARRMGGVGLDYGLDIVVDLDGNVYTTGYFIGAPQFGIVPLASVDDFAEIFVSKLNSGGDFLWTKIMGGTLDDQGYSIVVNSDGNVYTTGFFQGTADFDPGAGTFGLTSGGSHDIFVSKLDSNGSFVWAKRMGGGSNDEGYGIVLGSNGNVYTTGYYQGATDFDPGPGTFFLTSVKYQDIFVSILDSSGNFIGAKSMGGTSDDEGFGIVLDSVGNIYTTGRFAGTADFDPGTGVFNLTSAGGYDIFVSKLGNQAYNLYLPLTMR